MAEFLNNNIKYLRKVKKISQQDLANKIGVDRSTISRIENGEIETTIDNALKLAEMLHVPLNDLLGKDLQTQTKENKDNGIYIQKADGTTVFLKNASETDKALVELPEEQKKAILSLIGKRMDEIDKQLGDQ